MVNKLWLALEWYIPMLWLVLNGALWLALWLALHTFDVLDCWLALKQFLAMYGKVSSKQENRFHC